MICCKNPCAAQSRIDALFALYGTFVRLAGISRPVELFEPAAKQNMGSDARCTGAARDGQDVAGIRFARE